MNLQDNNMDEDEANTLSIALSKLKNTNSLQLDLQNNNIGDNGAESLSEALI